MATGTFKIGVKINGMKNLISSLQGNQKKLIAGMKEGVNLGTALVEAKAKEIVPVKTGNLMRAIFAEFENDGLKGIVGPDYLAAPYAYYVEFGRSKSGKQPPYPFEGRHYMERSFTQTKQQVRLVIRNSIKESLL